MSDEQDALLTEIEGKLLPLGLDELREICKLLNITVKEDEGAPAKTPRFLRKLIIAYLEGDDVINLEDEGMSVLLELNDQLDCLRRESGANTETSPPQAVNNVEPVNVVNDSTALQQQARPLLTKSGIATKSVINSTLSNAVPIDAPSLASPPVKLPLSGRSSSQVTAGQRSPDARRKRHRSHSPPVVRGPSPHGERPRQLSGSRSRSPRRRGHSRSPRRDRRGGVTELTNKMSQFMDLMMAQQSLLMSLATARATDEPVGPVANQPMVLPQPLPIPVAQQDAWDVDAISRDASEEEPLHGEDSVEAELTSHHSESEMEAGVDDSLWSLVERATCHLGIQWPATEQPRRSLFESPLSQGLQSRTLPAFPDFIKEVQSTWETPASAPATSRKAAAFNMQGASEAGLASFPPVGAAFAALVKSPTLSGLAKDPTCPNKQCRTTEVHLKRGYSAATEAVRLSNLASLLSVYQAALVKDLPDYPSVSLRAELGLIAQLLVKLAQLNARAQGRSIASLVVARRQLWLSQARVQEHDPSRHVKRHSSWRRCGQASHSNQGDHRSASGAGHRRSSRRNHGAV
ncbi:UNVERIFIED_CONTAM: hypothetical protein FKN15_009407 [Acipenser sinensis]